MKGFYDKFQPAAFRPFTGMNPNHKDSEFIFDSSFESGNCDLVVKVSKLFQFKQVGENEYDIFMRVDSNTKGHFNWFYFSIKSLAKKARIKINICNFTKKKCLYDRVNLNISILGNVALHI
jgi:hypothetical protein